MSKLETAFYDLWYTFTSSVKYIIFLIISCFKKAEFNKIGNFTKNISLYYSKFVFLKIILIKYETNEYIFDYLVFDRVPVLTFYNTYKDEVEYKKVNIGRLIFNHAVILNTRNK